MKLKRSNLMNRASSLVLACLLAGVGLAACNRAPPTAAVQQVAPPAAALPLSTDSSAPPLVAAPNVDALPPAPRARVARLQRPSDSYAFVERGYAMSHALADAPPDYAFDYDGVRPWVWRSDDQSEQVVEPVSGGDRTYYYRPGDDQPFLIRDPDYSYGFEGGQLVVVYDRDGRALPPEDADRRADAAGRYLARARALYAGALQRRREAVVEANWRARRDQLDAERQRWAAGQTQSDDWRAYHVQHDQEEQAQWDEERYRRQAEAARYAAQANDAEAAARFAAAAQQARQASEARRQAAPSNPPPAEQVRAPLGPQPQAHLQAQSGGPAQGAGSAPTPPMAGQSPSAQRSEPRLQGRQQAGQSPPALNAPARPPSTQPTAAQQPAAAQAQQQALRERQAQEAAAKAQTAQQVAAQQQQQQAQAQQQQAAQQAAAQQQAAAARAQLRAQTQADAARAAQPPTARRPPPTPAPAPAHPLTETRTPPPSHPPAAVQPKSSAPVVKKPVEPNDPGHQDKTGPS
jgi:hypothetical protein